MSWRKDDFDLTVAQVDHLAIGQIVCLAFVSYHEHRAIDLVGSIDADFVPLVDGRTGVVGMNMGSHETNGLLADVGCNLVQTGDLGACIDQEGTLGTGKKINRLVGHQVTIALPGLLVDLTEDDILVFEHHLLGIMGLRLCEGCTLDDCCNS